MEITTAMQIKNIDNRAITDYHIPGILLMENAALGFVRILEQELQVQGKDVVVLCGTGNNGGDGYAIARHLFHRGAKVCIVAIGEPKTPDAKTNCDIAMAMRVEFIQHQEEAESRISACDVIIDALYGVGFHGQMEGMAVWLAGKVNDSGKYVFAVDIPSGLCADNGIVAGTCIHAHTTITFTAYKPVHLLFPAAELCGKVMVCDIGVPSTAMELENIKAQTIQKAHIQILLPKRSKSTHKGDYGKVLVVAGSRGMSGAAYLSAVSAARSGAGLVTLCVPACIHDAMEVKTTEVMTLRLADEAGSLSAAALGKVLERTQSCDAVLFGPGLSKTEGVYEILKGLLAHNTKPLIIDADGINVLEGNTHLLDEAVCPVLLTPHTVEMARLTGYSPKEVEANPIDIAKEFSVAHGVTVLLKGAHTIIAAGDMTLINHETGNPGMATGGSGDVLGGMVVAFAARGYPLMDAAAAAVYLHGLAGDLAAAQKGQTAMLAGDILDAIGFAFGQFDV